MLERLHDDACEADRLNVMDRGYAKFALFNKIVKANSSYVSRLRDNIAYEVVESQALTDAATTAAPFNPVTGQTYGAMVARLLISLWTGRKPTKRTYEMICFYFLGVASEEELLAHLMKLQRQCEESSNKR